MKATVLHIIESLAVGGAEVLLTESLKGISGRYRHVVVYMRPPVTLLPEVKADKVYCLGYSGKRSILLSVYRLRKIINKERVALIHAHHYWPANIARLAKPASVPLVFSVHNPLSQDAFTLNRLSFYMEKLTYRSRHHAIFVSAAVGKDYNESIGIKGNATVLYNFAADRFYSARYAKPVAQPGKGLRMVAVGTLKRQKNYQFLLNVMALVKQREVYLDIIGDGPMMEELQASIKEKGLKNVKLKGSCNKVHEILHNYDAFILASAYEGFGIAMAEAMAIGLPCILSDIEVHREVTGGNALFFNLNSPEDCAAEIMELKENPELRMNLSVAGKKRAMAFQQQNYLSQLETLYKLYLP
ncbi:glycosyltransferase [Pontibacter sp. 172403-2]|uniref:glycosyltransferase n=1 Tax=Pontibacter rufus TaxID=2791028 RepID=UPI0018AFA07B|nr:glycosyltransferase [Pontibacter sp. 172403-2]MBF9252054.1 glycosyltransferase [Pontibacter sp. 172403-2]